MVAGAFDPLHHGHIEYFRQARALGGPLLCSIASDDYVATKHPPLLTASNRAVVIDALSAIDYTLVSRSGTETVLRELQPARFIKGRDWQGRLPANEERACVEHGTEIVFLDTVVDSSTTLLERYHAATLNSETAVSAFEHLVSTTRPVTFDDDAQRLVRSSGGPNACTMDDWRPEAITELLRPARVLDLSWGTGPLLSLLQQQGVVAEEVGRGATSRDMAPPTVRTRSRVGTTTTSSPAAIAADTYDLVICRDVLARLGVLQVRDLVRHMCRLSSRYVYVTTRCHPDPTDLLDVTSQVEVDPSATTLLNEDFLRVLLVLEGFRRRADLEAGIDSLETERVLVHEHAASVRDPGP